MESFNKRLERACADLNSLLCVGLDPKRSKLPAHLREKSDAFFQFNRAIIDATAPYCSAFKPQFAYYAGEDLLDDLKSTISYIRENFPKHLILLDVKRGDIGSTADEYAREAFEVYGADALTVNPYMGGDTLAPYTRFPDRGVIVLCKTSNPGSNEFQNLQIGEETLYEIVAGRAAHQWNGNDNISLVVGATYPEELRKVRDRVGDMPLLIPGIGAQGGDLEATLKAGLNSDKAGVLINSSRGIIFADSGENFADAAGKSAEELNSAINNIRNQL